jgi:hypothetical protein
LTWQESLRKSSRDSALAEKIVAAVSKILQQDAHLFRANVNERTIAHRLAIYVEEHFGDWDVDCEYNRDGHDPKEIAYGSGDDGEHGSRVLPDITVHHRGSSDNFLVIEIKKSNNQESDDRDFEKLAGYCQQLGYKHGLFLRFSVSSEPAVERAEFVYGKR